MKDKGFTLIEFLVTISILFIVLASAALIIDMDMFYLEKMADEFAADVRYVHMESIKSEAGNYRISIDPANRRYHIYNFSVVQKTVEFKSRYQIQYSNQRMDNVSFTHDGAPVNAGTFTILDKRTKENKQIDIVPARERTFRRE